MAIRRALFAGALLTLALAAVALLVLCLQQVRDARRPVIGSRVTVDRPAVATLTAAASGTVAVATALVLPAVRAATRPSGLRTE